ncbi:MAG: glycosyltransferase [Bacteroidetes bacterium]|nr:MAG: glycosyltransferase [Bacteroidota bacterium]
MNKKILYISYDGMTDPLGQSQVIPYLIGLQKKNFDITILSAEKQKNYSLHNKKIEKLLGANNIKWEKIYYTKKPPIISTVFDIYKLITKTKRLYKKEKFNIIHCRSYIAAFAGNYMKKKYKVSFIFDMRGFYADERVDGNIWNTNNFVFRTVYNFFKRKETQFLKNADYTISLTNAAKNIIYDWEEFKNKKPPIEVIPCCADLSLFSPENISKSKVKFYKDKLGIAEDDFVISYLGSIGTWYLLDEMLIFFKRLLIKKPNAKFLFISYDDANLIKKSAIKNTVPLDKIIIKKAEREDVSSLLSISNISIFFIKPVFSKKASSPTKLAEIMGMGIPIICNSNVGDVDEIINKTQAGLIINNFSINEFDKIIDSIDENIKISKEKIINSAQKNFSLQMGIEKYANIYNTLK